MTTRGGARVPDGKARPDPVPYSSGPNRTDLSALPGTPGTPLPNQLQPVIQHGQETGYKRALANTPLQSFQPGKPGGLMSPSTAPNEPITAGLPVGPGPGPEAMIPQPNMVADKLSASEMKWAYPVVMRLATLPNATQQTKIFARRLRALLPVGPQRMPMVPQEIMDHLRRQEQAGGVS